MGIIKKTFMFWLITGIIAALVITLVIPKLKTKVIEKIPGRNEAVKLVQQAKTAIKKHLSGTLVSASKVEQKIEEESIDEPVQQLVQDSIKDRDDKLFKRQCAILDDLL
jgi:uncharacterized membrane protein YraQ (UPF0718 family)